MFIRYTLPETDIAPETVGSLFPALYQINIEKKDTKISLGTVQFQKPWQVNADLFVLTYGSLVTQLLRDIEDVDAVNAQCLGCKVDWRCWVTCSEGDRKVVTG